MELRNSAQGRWFGILDSLGIAPSYLRNKLGPCPGCGGRDRFRWDDKDGNGTFFCNGGGNPLAGDGFGLVKHVFQIEFPEAAKMVEEALGSKQSPPISKRSPPPRNSNNLSKARRIWMEAESSDGQVASHPYCQLKGIDRACGAGRAIVSGSVVGKNADCIVIPLRSLDGRFKGVEVIGSPTWNPERKRHITPKQTFGSKGVLFLGNTLDKSLPIYLVEGWADAVSVWRLMGNIVVCAVFGDHKRQEYYAQGLNNNNPERDYILVRDA